MTFTERAREMDRLAREVGGYDLLIQDLTVAITRFGNRLGARPILQDLVDLKGKALDRRDLLETEYHALVRG